MLGEVGAQTRIIATYAPEPFKRRILPAVCSGDAILAICMTEPHAGTDVPEWAREHLLPDVLEGRIEPGRVFDRTVDLDGVPDGYRAMNDRETIKVMVRF